MALPVNNAIVRFGPFEANLSTQELHKFGARLRVPNQSFQILLLLLERPGQLVTREEIRQKLWPSDTFVEYDQGMNAAVNRLREALGDSADKSRFIETLPRRGYRFIATVESTPLDAGPGTTAIPGAPLPRAGLSQRTDEEKLDGAISIAPQETQRRPHGASHPTWQKIAMFSGIVLLLLIVAGLLLRWRNQKDTRNFSFMRVVPFTSLPGQEVAPSFSPDGSQIVFAWKGDSDKGFDLYVKTIGSERMLRLTQHASKWISPAWSPDGSQIAFARWSEQEDESGIFVIPALGGAERKLASARFWNEPFMQISWSPDAKSLAFWSITDGSHVYLLPLETLSARVLAPELPCRDAASPAFSPDGENVALLCTSSFAVYAIYVVPTSGGSPQRLTSRMGYSRGLTWSSDGKHVIFSEDSGDGGALWQVGLDGSLVRLLFGEQGWFPAVSHDKNEVAYVQGLVNINIWRLDLASRDSNKSATKLIFSTRIQRDPQYSPDGSKIVFDSNRSGASEIWMADANGNNPVQLTSFQGPQTGSPVWCSDGRRIAFDSRASGLSAVYIEDVGERLPRRVQTNAQNLSIPSWSTDCRWLYASDGNSSLYRIPSTGGDAIRVTSRPSYYGVVNGDWLYFNVIGPQDVEIWSRALDDGAEAPVKNIPRLKYADGWTVTPRGIYYTDSTASQVVVRFYDFATQSTRKLAVMNHAPTPAGGLGLAVSPDGRWLLYTQTDDEQSDIKLGQHEPPK